MNINLSKLDYTFKHKPLLIGGMAKEYYDIRKSGRDIDFVIHSDDYINLAEKYPNNKRGLFGDLGIMIHEFEIWKTICLFDYDFLSERAKEMGAYKIVSLEKLLFLTALGIKKTKYERDLRLIVDKIFELKYKK